jgi:hypothetical protein
MRYFTLEEATAALPQVRLLVEEMVQAYRRLRASQQRLDGQAGVMNGNGHHRAASAVAGLEHDLESGAAAMSRCLHQLEEIGVQVKDLDIGLIDFPARRGDETVLLCWHLGEEQIGYWHGTDEGLAGRKPLPL